MKVVAGQRIKGRLTESQTTAFIRQAAVRPSERRKQIDSIVRVNKFHEDCVLRSVGLQVDLKVGALGFSNSKSVITYYASPTSGEAYRDRQLTTNFELWVEIFCVPTCFHVRIPKPCLSVRPSVCPHPEKRYHHSFVNISPTLVIDTSMERSSRVLHHGNRKIGFFFFFKVRNSNFDFWRRAEITLSSSISVQH